MLIAEHSSNSDESHGLTNDNHCRISGITFLRFLHTRKYLLKRIVEFGLGILACNRTLVYLPSGYQKLLRGRERGRKKNSPRQTKYVSASEHKLLFPVSARSWLYFRDIYFGLAFSRRYRCRIAEELRPPRVVLRSCELDTDPSNRPLLCDNISSSVSRCCYLVIQLLLQHAG